MTLSTRTSAFKRRSTIKLAFLVAIILAGGQFLWLHRSVTEENERVSLNAALTNSRLGSWPTRHGSDLTRRPGRNNYNRTDRNPVVVVAGIIKNPARIQNATWSLLKDLSCQYRVSVHMVVSQNNTTDHFSPGPECAPLWMMEQEDSLLQGPARVQTLFPTARKEAINSKIQLPQRRTERLALLRDVQRTRIQQLLFDDTIHHLDECVVIVMDLDLIGVPGAAEVMQRVHLLRRSTTTSASDPSTNTSNPDVHVICAAGKEGPKFKKRFAYYDTFSTILYPDTFVYPRFRRYLKSFNGPDENTSLVTVGPFYNKKKVKNPFTQVDLMHYLRQKAKHHPRGLVPVRSCFGGMALYLASAWLSRVCHYRRRAKTVQQQRSLDNLNTVPGKEDKDDPALLLKYAGSTGHPCEHVVLHECLAEKVFHTDFAAAPPFVTIDPLLLTYWQG